MIIQTVTLYCIIGGIFLVHLLIIAASLEFKNIIQGVITKLFSKLIKKYKKTMNIKSA